jgi:hypothetical protein
MFIDAHQGLELRCGGSEEIDFWTESVEPFDNEYVLWSDANAAAAYARLLLWRQCAAFRRAEQDLPE